MSCEYYKPGTVLTRNSEDFYKAVDRSEWDSHVKDTTFDQLPEDHVACLDLGNPNSYVSIPISDVCPIKKDNALIFLRQKKIGISKLISNIEGLGDKSS